MTKREKALIRKAIQLIHHDDDYHGGMDILAKLVGFERKEPDVRFSCTIADLIAKSKVNYNNQQE